MISFTYPITFIILFPVFAPALHIIVSGNRGHQNVFLMGLMGHIPGHLIIAMSFLTKVPNK